MGSFFDFTFFLFLFVVVTLVLWVVALIDVVKSDFRGDNDKLMWTIVIVFTGFIGAIVYFVIGKDQRIQR